MTLLILCAHKIQVFDKVKELLPAQDTVRATARDGAVDTHIKASLVDTYGQTKDGSEGLNLETPAITLFKEMMSTVVKEVSSSTESTRALSSSLKALVIACKLSATLSLDHLISEHPFILDNLSPGLVSCQHDFVITCYELRTMMV